MAAQQPLPRLRFAFVGYGEVDKILARALGARGAFAGLAPDAGRRDDADRILEAADASPARAKTARQAAKAAR